MMQLSNCDDFYSRVLNDFSRNSNFLYLRIEHENQVKEVVLENAELFYMYYRLDNYTESDYKTRLKAVLNDQEILTVNNELYLLLQPYVLENCHQVESIAQKGHMAFLDLYFSNNEIKAGINDQQRSCIIRELFKWKMACHIADESGFLIVDR
jgi:hypothetical protein